MNRRDFFKTAAGAAAFLAMRRRAYSFYQSTGLRKFIQPARTFTSATPLVLAASDGTRSWDGKKFRATHYTINLEQFQDQLHPDLGPTTLWGYCQDGKPKRHLGGTIVAQQDTPVQITFNNKLPLPHIIPVDTTDFFYNAQQLQNKAAIHLHGGFIPWISDGGPFDWFTPEGDHGLSFKNNEVLAPDNPAGSAEYYYPNQQTSRLMWYHDHAHDVTRINAYAGLATGYVLRDAFENSLATAGLLPSLSSGAEIPLIFQDKIFVGSDILSSDPTWPGPTDPGSLWYPHIYEPTPSGRWDVGQSVFIPGTPAAIPDPSIIPEMFGDTMLVNGTVYPFLDVQPRRYRFRVLNACNSRFVNLQLYVRDNSTEGITLAQYNNELDNNGLPLMAPTNSPGPAMFQIGNEGGFLPAPVVFSQPLPIGFVSTPNVPNTGNANRYTLLLAPAERADVVIDFKDFAGKTLVLYTDASAPFPVGDPLNDYYFGMTDLSGSGGSAGPAAGYGPNTRTLMEIRVAESGPKDPIPTSSWLGALNNALQSIKKDFTPLKTAGVPVRRLSLNEDFDAWGRLIQMMGTDVSAYPLATTPFFGRLLESPATEVLQAGGTEIWEIYNLTGDTHPIHIHLVNGQLLNRQVFDPASFPNVTFLGDPRPPDANERGWKETFRVNPGEVLRFIAKFDLPKLPFTLPTSDRTTLGLPSADTLPSGQIYHEYVYHCHILEHEEHDMMRPLVVVGPENP